MTVREALLASLPFSTSDEQVEMVSISRDLCLDDDFTSTLSRSSSFELAKADMIKTVVLMPNISEGGVSISITDRKALIGLANSIYGKYNEELIQEQQPTVQYIEF